MSKSIDMIDIAFNLQGGYVPASYPFALWQEIVHCLPWLNEEQLAGILPLRGSVSGGGLLLPQRAKDVVFRSDTLTKLAQKLLTLNPDPDVTTLPPPGILVQFGRIDPYLARLVDITQPQTTCLGGPCSR